jgi:chorismate--pyruvate lyase
MTDWSAARMRRYGARGGWTAHLPFDTTISPNLRRWVTGEGSLTVRLMAASRRFRVSRVAQRMELPLGDEWQALGLGAPVPVLARDVLLICDDVPAVYGHTVVFPDRARRDWPFLGGLGERPLGGALFVDPRVHREPFQFARLRPHHPLWQRLQRALPAQCELPPAPMLPARRSVFRRGDGVMLVTEVFLPDLATRPSPTTAGNPAPTGPARDSLAKWLAGDPDRARQR